MDAVQIKWSLNGSMMLVYTAVYWGTVQGRRSCSNKPGGSSCSPPFDLFLAVLASHPVVAAACAGACCVALIKHCW